MIHDLESRRTHWDDPAKRAPREEHDLTDSLPYPFGDVGPFRGRDVLEVGPGRGRQYEVLRGMASSYAVCDISPCALAEPVFASATARYLLTDYGDDFGVRFDVVHFWYVLHHIRTDELDDFFGFVARHLRPSGYALFNTPQDGNDSRWYTGDGMGTTWMDESTVRAACIPHLAVVECRLCDDRSTGWVFVTRKI